MGRIRDMTGVAAALTATVLGLFPTATSVSATAQSSAAGLVPLPCASAGALRPHASAYCLSQRHYMTPAARSVLLSAADRFRVRHPDTAITYMAASWPIGRRPMPPHLSHGDGRQIDMALFYADVSGRPLARPPTVSGYGAYEPPTRAVDRSCSGRERRAKRIDGADPRADRTWRLDEVRTRDLIRSLSADPKVRRIFIEPHLKRRLGFAGDRKVRFAGCKAARHDDHLHVDFF
jgi:hypothetical protein